MSKLITQFVVGMVVVAFCLLSSFILTATVLPLEHPTLASAEYKFSNHNVFSTIYYNHTFIAVILFIILESFVFGIIGCIGFVFAYLLNNVIMVMLSTFIIYYMDFILSNLFGRYGSLMAASKVAILYKGWEVGFVIELMIIVVAEVVMCIMQMNKKILYRYGGTGMKKAVKRICIVAAVLISVCLIMAIISVNVKYNKYFEITELDMTEHYITDWGMVSINRAKIFNKDDFINEFQDVKLDMLDADIYEGTDYMVIYVTFNVDDVDKYDAEWFKMWSLETDNGWRNGKDMILNANLNNANLKITKNGTYEMYCAYNLRINNMSIDTFDELYKLNYKVLINQNPIVYYKLEINI